MEYIKLTPFKISDKQNKKIISTSVFIPSNPKLTPMSSAKVASYITGLIKKVEQFSKVMSDKWILRIYYEYI